MSMIDDLREVVRLLKRTTPGPWLYRSKSASWHKPVPEGTNYSYGEFIFKLGDDENDASYYDEEFLVKTVQFMQKHAAQIEQDARDAERYRWLRNKSYGQCEHPICVAQLPQMLGSERVGITYIGPMIGEVLDQAIDAAMAKESGK